MEFNLYIINDSANVINKTMTNKLTYDINLKRDVDITSPVILLADVLGTNHSAFNYAEIPQLGRFYFVDKITRMNNKIIMMELSCDVLETYKADVLASRARFMRNIKNGDYYQGKLDSAYSTTVKKINSDKGLDGNKDLIMVTIGG